MMQTANLLHRSLSFAKKCVRRHRVTLQCVHNGDQAAEVGNLDDPSDTRDLPCMWTLLVES
jgi:hypothetical protein